MRALQLARLPLVATGVLILSGCSQYSRPSFGLGSPPEARPVASADVRPVRPTVVDTAPQYGAPMRPYPASRTDEQRRSAPVAMPQNQHTVVPGDTLYGLSQRYRIAVYTLMRANNLTSATLYSGQKLLIPRG